MEGETKEKCWLCDNLLPIFGAVASVVILLVAVDLMSNGKLSALILPARTQNEETDE